MEAPGFMILLYQMFTIPQEEGIQKLPWPNWLMAILFVRSSPSVNDYSNLYQSDIGTIWEIGRNLTLIFQFQPNRASTISIVLC